MRTARPRWWSSVPAGTPRCGSCSEHKFKFSGCVQSMVRISLAPPFIAGLRICLLYTSDAADDM
eukprot:11525516-Alexandrium_andersonii.AAC.1